MALLLSPTFSLSLPMLLFFFLSLLSLCHPRELTLTAILPINNDVNGLPPSLTNALASAISLGVDDSNTQQIIDPSFGVSLRVEFRDDHGSEQLALEAVLSVVTESSPLPTGIIGGYYSSTTKLISMVANGYGIPQVSGSATSASLSNKTIYPLFARTVPPDNEQANVLAKMVKLFGWSKVGVLYTTDLYATGLKDNFKTACDSMGIKITAQQFAALGQKEVVRTLLQTMKDNKILIIVLFMQSRDAITVFNQAIELEMMTPAQVWIGADSLATLTTTDPELSSLLRGLIVTTSQSATETPGYAEFEQRLADVMNTPISGSGNTYVASFYDVPFVYAHAINSLLTAHGSDYSFTGQELYNAILGTTFSGVSTSTIQFNSNGDLVPATFEVLNWRNGGLVPVGSLSSASTTPPAVIFNDGTSMPPKDSIEILDIAVLLPLSALPAYCQAYFSLIGHVFDKLNAEKFLPNNLTLRMIPGDDEADPGVGTVRTVDLEKKKPLAFIGSLTSSVSKSVAVVLSNIYHMPQLNFASTSPDLSNKDLYPYFLRNVPSDTTQSEALAAIVHNFKWKNVVTINTREPYGSDGVQAFNNISNSRYQTRVVLSVTFAVGATDLSEIMRQIKNSPSTVIISFINLNDCPTVFREARRAGLLTEGYVWIHSDACASWGRSFNETAWDQDPMGADMRGTLGVIPDKGSGDTYDRWVTEMSALDPVKYPGISDVTMYPYTSHAYDIGFVLATAIKNAVESGEDHTNQTALLAQLKKTNYSGITGLNAFDGSGNRISNYNLLSWANSNDQAFSTVGYWTPTNNIVMVTAESLHWIGTSDTYPDFTPTDAYRRKEKEDHTVIIAVVVVLGSLLIIAVALLAFFMVRRKHKKEKEEIPASFWDDEPLLKKSLEISRESMEISGADAGKGLLKYNPATGVNLSKTNLTFGISSNDRFPIDKRQRDEVEITNTSAMNVRKFRVYVPNDPARFSCQVFPGAGELKRNEPVTLKIDFKLFLMTHINRKIKIEIDGCPEPCFLSMQFKGDVSDKIDPDEIDIQGDPIGEGGFGLVYQGRFRGTEVAVKTAHAKNEGVKSFLDEFTRELDMMRRLHHPNIITFIGASFIPGKMGIVTEYCKRGSLAKLIHSGARLSLGLKVKIALDIANGVSFLHENGVLHRDIKPDNVLLVSTNYFEQNCAKITDFGTAKSVNQHLQNFAHTNGIGTPIYMAPEILQRMQYSTKVDVFSFGVLLWELYTQLHPYHFIKLHWDIPGFVISGNRNPIPPDCPKELEDLINRCWADDPNERPSFAEIAQVLDGLLQPIKMRTRSIKYGNADPNSHDLEDSLFDDDSSPVQSDSRNTTGGSFRMTGGHMTNTGGSFTGYSHRTNTGGHYRGLSGGAGHPTNTRDHHSTNTRDHHSTNTRDHHSPNTRDHHSPSTSHHPTNIQPITAQTIIAQPTTAQTVQTTSAQTTSAQTTSAQATSAQTSGAGESSNSNTTKETQNAKNSNNEIELDSIQLEKK